jgi:GWxTD domain-containing protein
MPAGIEGETIMLARRPLALAVLAFGLLPAPAAHADKLSKEDKAWLDSVTPILLKDEEKRFKELKDKVDREEFKKIFWARRDPDLDTPENEYQAEYQKQVAVVDAKFKKGGQIGSKNDCGKVFILLGEPTSIEKDEEEGGETWIYKDSPGRTFAGGQAAIAFTDTCQGPTSKAFEQQVDRIAESRLAHPNIDYRIGSDGKLAKLVDLLPKPTPAQALLKTPRQDFPLETQAAFLKTEGGGTALVGVVRGKADGLEIQDAGGKKTVRVSVVAQAVTEDGKNAAFAEQEEAGDVRPDGTFLATYRMLLKPGKYTLKGGALEVKSAKGSLAQIPVDVPDLNKAELTATLIVLRDVEDLAEGVVDNNNAYSGMALAKVRLIPHFGSTFSKADSLMIFFQFYDAQADAATGKTAVTSSVALRQGTKNKGKAPDQNFDTIIGGNVIGPIPLSDYAPGNYSVQVKLTDGVAKKEVVKEFAFEMK